MNSTNVVQEISDDEQLDPSNNEINVTEHQQGYSTENYHEDDPLFIGTEDGEQLEQPRASQHPWLSHNFHSTTSVNERRHTEPVRPGLQKRSNSLRSKLSIRNSAYTIPRHSHELIHLIESEDNPIVNEQERLRNSIMSKRELKKKRRETMEDEKVAVGNKVGEGHSNYIMAYSMLTGIRVSVSRYSGPMKPLSDLDFWATKKLAFDFSGTELTPSSKYSFKFKDYAPEVFRELRSIFGLDPADYLMSLTSKYVLSELGSPGKSGSFFYYSRDYRFIIKTIHHSEHRKLRASLKEYHNYVKKNPGTLISQFYGLHRLKIKVNGVPRKIHFLVMNNLFPTKTIDRQYDLKGSTDGRYTRKNPTGSEPPTKTVVYKDLNWLEDGYGLKLKSPDKVKLVNQLRSDVKILQKLKIMDYSMLIGVHHIIPGEVDEESGGGVKFYQCLKSDDNDCIYYIGVIDCLTGYTVMKRAETLMRRIGRQKNFSCINAHDYGDRFIKFMESHVFSKDKVD